MELELKAISKSGIPAALKKAELYRNLNEPGEAESICRDILAIEPDHQLARRQLGLAITDRFKGEPSDRHEEAARLFEGLADPYERVYYMGLLHERRAKAYLRSGHPPHTVPAILKDAMRRFEEAEKIRPKDNDDAILRWNRCVRLIREWEIEMEAAREREPPAPILGD